MNNTKNLFVYDASAGSGKTYTLSEKFFEYLISEYNNGREDAYKYIMAVTFTNKATIEMKDRIIQRLYENSLKVGSVNQQKAREILQNLVHDYTMFKVSTIDSFFQKVLKAFAIEVGSSSAFDTVLDPDIAIESALDSVYSKIDTDARIRETLQNISLARLEDCKSWNWRDDLLKLSKSVLATYKPSGNNTDITSYAGKLQDRIEKLEEDFVEKVILVAEELKKACSRYGLDSRPKIKSNFVKWLKGEQKLYVDEQEHKILERPEWMDNWFASKDSVLNKQRDPSADMAAIESSCGDLLRELKGLYDNYYVEYLSLRQINKYIRESSLFGIISKEMEEYLKSEQQILLSDAPKILKKLIGDNDAPFVYEKIGTIIDHYLLDEFQDTSWEQWKNFLPLLIEGVSRNNQSLLVGDIKQSIYRFRGGDWNLLDKEVRKEFQNPVRNDFYSAPLRISRRSLANIVYFNNLAFASPGFIVEGFKKSLEELTKDIIRSKTLSDVYANAAQEVWEEEFGDPCPQKGVVHVIYCADIEKDNVISQNDFINWDVARRIKRLVSSGKGFTYGSIGILTSSGKEASMIANYLVSRGIPIVSGDSLKIDSNPVVSLVLEILKKLAEPEDQGVSVISRLAGAGIAELKDSNKEWEDFLGKFRKCTTLYQICILILKEFIPSVDAGNDSYVKAFLDRVLDYSSVNGTSISDFLSWWSISSDKFCIPEPSNNDAVKILTMHKAKGLDFPVVFIPYLRDEMIDFKNGCKWFSIKDKSKIDYDNPLLLPLGKKGNDLDGTYYQDAINNERMEQYLDNLNLAYVSFTRPKERLYVYAPSKRSKNSKGSPSKLSVVLGEYCQKLADGAGSPWKRIPETFSAEAIQEEDPSMPVNIGKAECSSIDYVLGDDDEVSYVSTHPKPNSSVYKNPVIEVIAPGLSHMIKDTAVNESSKAPLKVKGNRDENIRRGILYHELFSYIDARGNMEGQIEEKVAKAVDWFLKKNQGSKLKYMDRPLDKDSLGQYVLKMVKSVKAKGMDWFDEGQKILGEQSILSKAGTRRPDRIILPAEGKGWAEVVDYKFGEYEKDSDSDKKYHKQVENYMNLLKDMGYLDVKGYLWYVLEDKIVEVKQGVTC